MTVKTLAEVHADRVTVTVTLNTETPQAMAYDPNAAAEVLAENYARAKQKIADLEADKTAGDAGTIEGLRDRIADLEADITRRVDNAGEGERQIRDLSESLARVQASRDEWREKHAEMTKQRDEERKRASEATAKLARITELLDNHEVRDAMEDAVSKGGVFLSQVLEQIRNITAR